MSSTLDHKLTWLFFDLDCYFASVEQQLNPELREKPIIVVPALHDSGTAIAASYEARKYGIKTGTRIYQAKKLYPDIICVKARPDIYVQYHDLIFSEIDKYLFIDHVLSIDEGACKLTGLLTEEKHAISIALKLQNAISKNIGEKITCSIGISTNKFVAKVASSIKKPNSITVIHKNNIISALSKLKLRDLPGIGMALEKRLNSIGICSVNDLYNLKTPKDLERAFGNINGYRYFYLIRGEDIQDNSTKTSSVSQSRVLTAEESSSKTSREVLMHLSLKAAQRLRFKEKTTNKVSIELKLHDKRILKASKKITRGNDSITISKAILTCFDDLLKNSHFKTIQKVSLVLSNIEDPTQQRSLFDFTNTKKKDSISKVLDVINTKFGTNSVSLGLVNLTKHEHDSIAFNHIPRTK